MRAQRHSHSKKSNANVPRPPRESVAMQKLLLGQSDVVAQ